MLFRFDEIKDKYIDTYVQMHGVGENDNVPEHSHDFYEIVIVTEGRIIHSVNETEQHLKTSDIVFIRADDRHYYKKGFDADVINIAFTSEVLNGFESVLNRNRFQHIIESKYPFIKNAGGIFTNKIKSDVLKTYSMQTDSLRWEIAMKEIIFKLLSFLIVIEKENNIPEWLDILIEEMLQTENFVSGTNRLYEISGKSREHVSRQVHLNMTPTDFINSLRINYAKNLLVLSNDPIIQICYKSGFENLNYFYKVFKKIVGNTPVNYRVFYKANII